MRKEHRGAEPEQLRKQDLVLDSCGGVGLTVYTFISSITMAAAYMISGGLNGGYSQELVELAFIGNALLYMADIAMGCAGIVGIISLLAMATPVGIILGAGLAVLTIIAMHMINEALEENFRQMEAYINGKISGDEIVNGFIWNVVLTVATFGLSKGIEKGMARAAERYLAKVVGARLAGGLLSEGASPTGLVRAVKNMKNLGYTDDFIRELADNISAEQLIRMNRMNRKGLGKELLDILFGHSRQLGNYSDDLIWQLERMGSYTDDILKLVDDYGEAFTRQIGADDLRRLGGLVNKGLPDDVVDAVILHVDNFADYSDDTIKKIAGSGCNAERILTQIDTYAKDFTEDLTAGQLKHLDDILEQGVTPEQFEVLVKHGKQLENYTDEVIGLWRNYTGNGDDFLKLVDEFGDEFVEAFKNNGEEAVWEFNGLLGNAKYSEEEIQRILEKLRGDGFANNPLRQAYESEVSGLKSYGEELLSSGMSEEDVARTLNQARRDLGIKYKDMTPQPLRDYIYEINLGRYGDELGPTYEWLVNEKGASNMDIIRSASTPNSNIDRLLSGFEEWLRRQ